MLSASISNSDEIAEWISQIRKKEVTIIRETERPVELRMAVLHPEHGVLPLETTNSGIRKEIERIYKSNRRHFSPSRGGFPMSRGRGGSKGRSGPKNRGKSSGRSSGGKRGKK